MEGRVGSIGALLGFRLPSKPFSETARSRMYLKNWKVAAQPLPKAYWLLHCSCYWATNMIVGYGNSSVVDNDCESNDAASA